MWYRRLHAEQIGAVLVLAFALAMPRAAEAAATITVVNLDGPGEGFNDPSPPDPASTAGGNTGTTLGAQRLIAFQRAADIWGRFVDSSTTIRVGANFDPLSCSASSTILGSAGPETVHANFAGAPRANTWYPQALANSLRGSDIRTDRDDIGARFNSAIGTTCPFPRVWYYGLDADPPLNTIDFLTVVLHEIGHGLGFLTLVSLSSGSKFQGLDDAYMVNLENHLTGELYPAMTNAQRVAASTATGNLHWVGPEVVGAGAGLASGRHPSGHVEMYAPNPARSGSSVSHFSTSLGPNDLMEPSFTTVIHGPGLSGDLMADIGWSTGAGDAAADLAGDRTSDIVWRNTVAGGTIAWLMNGFEKGIGPVGGPATTWRIEALGDFDGLGNADIVWRNTGSGNTIIWQMNAFDTITTAPLGAVNTAWRLAGVGDFDSDGTTDILWHNLGGATVIWRMRALGKAATSTFGAPDPVWQVRGVGDFDGDGTDDIMWRNTTTGAVLFWKIVNLTKAASVPLGVVDQAWEIAGVGDFDGDETDDILWRNTSSGSTVIWRILGFGKDSSGGIGNPSTTWQVACVGDYNGGGKSDILWRNTSSGNAVIWEMNGFTKDDTGGIGAPNTNWQTRC